MSSQWNVFPTDTQIWDTTKTAYAGTPVVYSTTTDTVTLPAGTAADNPVGVCLQDIGPAALNQAATAQVVSLQKLGRARMYAGGVITAGQKVRINTATIAVTPPGYTTTVNVWPVIASAQTAAGSQPYPIIGVARNSVGAAGEIVYVDLQIGMTY